MERDNDKPLLFTILNKLYTDKSCKWLNDLDEDLLTMENIQPYIIQRWLVMNDTLSNIVRWLDKYVFVLNTKMYLSLAWSVIPKLNKMPFVKYISKDRSEDEWYFITHLIRHHFKLSDNDFNAIKSRVIDSIKLDKINWFSYYGIEKKLWMKYGINFELIKNFDTKEEVKAAALSKWGF